MNDPGPSAEQQVAFLRKLQRLLDEGEFVATYKFALLQALADLAVEHASSHDGSLIVGLDEIAAKFIEYYWRQTVPFRSDPDARTGGVLRQNTGSQAAIVNRVARARSAHEGSLLRLQIDARAWQEIVRDVARVIEEMPLWKLQTVGGESDEFLYRRSEFQEGHIRLLPGIAADLRAFYPLITQLVRGGWVDQVRRIGRNQPLLGSVADLHEFLFGSDRQTLDGYRSLLKEHQASRCFYCHRETDRGEADHFVPWSRYAVDLGHNFVYACTACNNAKRDYLADVEHLAHWREDNLERGADLSQLFATHGLAHDQQRSEFVATWAYEQAEAAGAHGWIAKDRFMRIDGRWRAAIMPLASVAEPKSQYQWT